MNLHPRASAASYVGLGGLGESVVNRLGRNDLSLKRKTRNCGDTAGMVLGGLRELSKTETSEK